MASLKERMLTTKGDLIFPAKSGGKEGHFLRQLKELAVRAGIKPESVGLHKWRKAFATLQHRAGVDARTLQKRLGRKGGGAILERA
jgi:integrase